VAKGVTEATIIISSTALVAEVEGDKVRLSANADVAVSFEEEVGGRV
jgi:hypothetical protein